MYILHSVVVVGSVGVVGIVTKDNDNNMKVIRYFWKILSELQYDVY